MVAYFDLVYRLLLGSVEGRRFMAASAPPGAPTAHSYLTAADMEALFSFLDLSGGDVVLDLGCGYGEIAIAVHRRTGADVIGIEASRRALVEARRRFAAAKVERHVQGVPANLSRVPAVAQRARAAYEIDALMFVPSHWAIYAALLRRMGPGSRLFATTLEFGAGDHERTRRRLLDSGISVEALDDVSDEMMLVSELRRRTALGLLRSGGVGLRGRLAMLFIVVEETTIGYLRRRGLVRRWRMLVSRAPGG
ncbi:MAG: cyclopropane-fatty-acyl-phospholipid synthase family protein [Chloroflexota bacterium]